VNGHVATQPAADSAQRNRFAPRRALLQDATLMDGADVKSTPEILTLVGRVASWLARSLKSGWRIRPIGPLNCLGGAAKNCPRRRFQTPVPGASDRRGSQECKTCRR